MFQDVSGNLLHSCRENLYRTDERAGLKCELHEEAALYRSHPDAGERPRHHPQVHSLSPLEPHG